MEGKFVSIGSPEDTVKGIDALCEVERKAWSTPGENIEAGRKKIEARVASFPKGVSLALVDGKSAGSQYAFMLNWNGDLNVLTTWDSLTNCGWTNTVHDNNGNTGFLVGVGVVPEFRGQRFQHNLQVVGERRISELLIIYTLNNLFSLGVDQVIACARIPLYHTKPELSVADYCQLQQDNGELYDPVLRFHKRLGASIIKPVEYAMEDTESLNAGCWVQYNP